MADRGLKMNRRSLTKLSLLCALSVLGSSAPAGAVTVFSFRGTVTDAIGRTLSGATVKDQYYHSATTASDGNYTLPEDSTGGQFTLKASRSDTSVTTKSVNVDIPLDTTVDFTLYYRISAAISKTYLTTASGPNSATLTITSRAPNPGLPGESGGKSCVYVTDSRTSQTTSATLQSTDPVTGASTWTHAVDLLQATTEGSYSLAFVANDCSSGVRLSSVSSPVPYVVDNTPVTIGRVLPVDLGQTALPTQPILAELTDSGGSGVNVSSIALTLDGQALARSYSGGLVVSTPQVMAAGDHGVTLIATDNAGNASATRSWSFAVVGISLSLPDIFVDATPVDIPDTFLPGDTLSFTDPKVGLGASTVMVEDNRHEGYGVVLKTLDLSKIKARFSVLAGTSYEDRPVRGLSATTQYSAATFAALATGTMTESLDGRKWSLPALTAEIPAAADRDKQAYLVIEDVAVTVSLQCPYLPAPASSYKDCDPVPHWMPRPQAAQIISDYEQRKAEHQANGDRALGTRTQATIIDSPSGTHLPLVSDELLLPSSPPPNLGPHPWRNSPQVLYRRLDLWGYQGNDSKVVSDLYFNFSSGGRTSSGKGQATLAAAQGWQMSSPWHRMWDSAGDDVSSATDEFGFPIVSVATAGANATIGKTFTYEQEFYRLGENRKLARGWLSSLASRSPPSLDCPFCPNVKSGFGLTDQYFVDPVVVEDGYLRPAGPGVVVLEPLRTWPNRSWGPPWTEWVTVFYLNRSVTYAEAESAVLSTGGALTFIWHAGPPLVGGLIGEGSAPDALAAYRDGYRQHLQEAGWIGSQDPSPCAFAVTGSHTIAELGAVETAVGRLLELGPTTPVSAQASGEGCDAPAGGADTVNSPPPEDRPAVPWWPSYGTIKAWSSCSATNPILCRHVNQRVKWSDQQHVRNLDGFLYEHSLKQISSLADCYLDADRFWAYRGRNNPLGYTPPGFWSIDVDFPPSSGPYPDTTLFDDCDKHNLTVGVAKSQHLSANRLYKIWVTTTPGRENSSTFEFGPDADRCKSGLCLRRGGDYVPVVTRNRSLPTGSNCFEWTIGSDRTVQLKDIPSSSCS